MVRVRRRRSDGPAVLLLPLVLQGLTNGVRAGQPQVYDGGEWHNLDESIGPEEPVPCPPMSESWKSDDATILVSISSFRDYRCARTLENLFQKATNPKRVMVGVVQQNSKGDTDCLYDYCIKAKNDAGIKPAVTTESTPAEIMENCPYGDQVRMLRTSAEDAKGPTYGRYLSGKLLRDEDEFCMQIDAHMDFLYNWDRILLDMWGERTVLRLFSSGLATEATAHTKLGHQFTGLTKNEYGVLSTYVPRLEEMGLNANERWEIPHICRAFFTPGDRMVRNEQAKAAICLTTPKLTSTWAAGFAFNKCHADRRVPYRCYPSLFDGEEFSKYARLWTKGYDVYTPHRSVVYHDYNHGANTVAANSWNRRHIELQESHNLLRTLLGMPDATIPRNSSKAHEVLGIYDLGTKRTLDQLIEFTGVDTRNHEITKSSCRKLVWVPFDPEGEGDGDPMTASAYIPGAAPDTERGGMGIGRRLSLRSGGRAWVSGLGDEALQYGEASGREAMGIWLMFGGALLLFLIGAAASQVQKKDGGDYVGRKLDV